MSQIISKELSGDGTRFVNAQLLAGGILARAVAAVRGPVMRASAPLPETLDPGALTNFEYGGVTSLDRTISWLVPYVAGRCRDDLDSLRVVEDSWATSSDVRDPSNEPLLRLSEQNAMLYVVSGNQLTELVVKGLFRFVRSFCYAGFIIDTTKLQAHPVCGISAFELAEHVKSVFVSAFDREGIVCGGWAPDE